MKKIKPKVVAALLGGAVYVVAVTLTLSSYHANQTKRGDGTCHVLPRVEDMPSTPNPLQF